MRRLGLDANLIIKQIKLNYLIAFNFSKEIWHIVLNIAMNFNILYII